jgi:SAM-dependent methyltransferase
VAKNQVSPLESQQLHQKALKYGTFWHRVRSEMAERELSRFGATKVLDIGAGAGHLGRWLKDTNPSIEYFFDEELETLRAQLVIEFGEDALRGPDGMIADIDVVCMLDVIEHIEDDVEFLRALHSRMRDDSVVVATVPAMKVLYSTWDTALGHFRRYDRKGLTMAFRESGFEVLECSYCFPEMVPLAFVRRLSRRKKGASSAEFPNLPRIVDKILWIVCRTSGRLRRCWPLGTSLLIVGKCVPQRS